MNTDAVISGQPQLENDLAAILGIDAPAPRVARRPGQRGARARRLVGAVAALTLIASTATFMVMDRTVPPPVTADATAAGRRLTPPGRTIATAIRSTERIESATKILLQEAEKVGRSPHPLIDESRLGNAMPARPPSRAGEAARIETASVSMPEPPAEPQHETGSTPLIVEQAQEVAAARSEPMPILSSGLGQPAIAASEGRSAAAPPDRPPPAYAANAINGAAASAGERQQAAATSLTPPGGLTKAGNPEKAEKRRLESLDAIRFLRRQ